MFTFVIRCSAAPAITAPDVSAIDAIVIDPACVRGIAGSHASPPVSAFPTAIPTAAPRCQRLR